MDKYKNIAKVKRLDFDRLVVSQGANVLPPTLEWIGLTGVEINHIFAANVGYPERMMQEVEAKLKEKNGG